MRDAYSLTQPQVSELCRPGEGSRTCSFLAYGEQGLACVKGTGDQIEATILRRRATKSMGAMGDNCSGYPEWSATPTSGAPDALTRGDKS